MIDHHFSRPRLFLILLLTLTAANGLIAQEQAPTRRTLTLSQWLVLGPLPYHAPAFHAEDRAPSAFEKLLKYRDFPIHHLQPENNLGLTWHDGSTVRWSEAEARSTGIELEGSTEIPSCAYLATYIEVERWTPAQLIIDSPQVFRVWQDGQPIAIKTVSNGNDDPGDKTTDSKDKDRITVDLKMENGKHLILIKTLHDPETGSGWSLQTRLTLDEPYQASDTEISRSPLSRMSITHLLDGPKPVQASVSADGSLAALTIRRTLPPGNESESWLEIHDTQDGRLLRTFRGGDAPSRIRWAPAGHRFAYVSYGKSGGTLWVVDLENGTTLPILENVPNLADPVWTPDAGSLIYSVAEEGPTDRPGVRRVVTMADRQPGWRNRSYLYIVNLRSGARRRLTAGSLSTGSSSITPDGRRLLVTRARIDLKQRPYSITELHELKLDSLETRLLWEGPWLSSAQWVPDGKKLLMLGGPSLFGILGLNNAAGGVPNEYDTQAYLFDPDEQKVEPLTKNFDPSINQAVFSLSENCIYFLVTERAFVRLYRYKPASKEFELLFCGADVIDGFSLAREKPLAVYIGSSAATPPKAYAIDLKRKASRLFSDPSRDTYKNVKFGRVEKWSFKNKSGISIDGRIYFPPDFDPKRKYPLIVNYYGGTTPVSRSFGGRYPLNYYAGQGYLVYVLQPSGAVGFGQSFSALHVNDWGQIVSEEIIEGVKAFLSEHPYADAGRIGCIGASFGGFMTMLLQTRSNLFAAAIAHAGISSISSYWGEGFWGYLYSAYATANSFPWNRKDLYISQSPLYHADKISTPLLLLHGSADTNVPSGESTQLFTALKLLGREVEYIQILDQDHHIMTYNKRIIWTKTIIAWFDRWLKRQPQWWYELYPPILEQNNEKKD